VRRITLYISNLNGCCRVEEIHEFTHNNGIAGKTIKDEEWFKALLERGPLENRLICFAHSSKENSGRCTPRTFAEWLRRKGEKVTQVKHKHITLYTCALSTKFWNEYQVYYKKNADDQRGRGSF
jgi:hypothetical protein